MEFAFAEELHFMKGVIAREAFGREYTAYRG
jgi:hypothetical protein